ncbi:MAG: helix-turn-helix transcriptional regulator [Gemmataceae bacterium]|nr:helix-turn-helix transcriptional regulator [Gemmataceae bacterium]
MMIKHVHRKARRTPQETAKLRADRERYQRDKPSPEQLLAEGGHNEFVPLGELIFIHEVMTSLKKERERQGLTLATLAKRTGIDQAALSKLETGTHGNPTLETLYRIALALDKVIACVLKDAPVNGRRRRRLARAR